MKHQVLQCYSSLYYMVSLVSSPNLEPQLPLDTGTISEHNVAISHSSELWPTGIQFKRGRESMGSLLSRHSTFNTRFMQTFDPLNGRAFAALDIYNSIPVDNRPLAFKLGYYEEK